MYPFLRPVTYTGDLVPGYYFHPNGASCEVTEGAELQSDLLRASGNYGAGVKQLGDELFVGETGAVGAIFVVGEVHYYTRTGSADPWTRQSGFHSDVETSGGEFGSDIDYDGARVIVGEPNASKTADVFTFAGGTETFEQTISANTYTDPASRFGKGVALDGDHALIGAPGQDITETDQGGVEYWERVAGTWTFRQAFTMDGTPNTSALFGAGVTLLDNATAHISWVTTGGSIVVERWTRSGTTWTFDSNFALIGYDAQGFLQLDSDGTSLILGFPLWEEDAAPGSDNVGIAIVLTPGGSVQSEVKGTTIGNQLGAGVTIEGSEAVIGEPQADPSAVANAGIATVYNVCP